MNAPLIRIFFDANVLIAGSFSQTGASFLLLQLCELGLLKGLTCKQVIDECQKNIRDKLPQAESTFNKIVECSIEVAPNSNWTEINTYQNMAHRKDLPILTAALTVEADYLVTFDTEDFYPESKLGLRICRSAALLKEIRSLLTKLGDK